MEIIWCDWCGWTQKQIKDLGGKDNIKSIYVDCVKDEEKCRKMNINGFPHWKNNNGSDMPGMFQ